MSTTVRAAATSRLSSRASRGMAAVVVAGAVAVGGALVAPAAGATPAPRDVRDTGFLYANVRLVDGGLRIGLTKDVGWMDMTPDLPWEPLNTVAVHVGDEYKTTFPEAPEWSEYAEPGSPYWSTDAFNGPLSVAFSAVDLDGEQFTDPTFPVEVTLEDVRGSNGAVAPGYLWWGSKPSPFNSPENTVLGSGPEQSRTTSLTPETNVPISVQAAAPGGYCVDLTASGTLADGTTVVTSPVTTLAIAVGDEIDPASVVCGDEERVPSASTTSVSVSGPTAYGRTRTAAVQVTADDQPAAGEVTVKLGSKTLATAELADGRVEVTIPASTPAGTHEVTATYEGSADPEAPVEASSGSTSFTVTKAKTTAKLTVSKRTITKRQRAKATVRVVIPGAEDGIHPGGEVRLYDGRKRIKTISLRAAHRGKISVRLPRLAPGRHKIKATYAGSTNTKPKSTTRTTVRVTKK